MALLVYDVRDAVNELHENLSIMENADYKVHLIVGDYAQYRKDGCAHIAAYRLKDSNCSTDDGEILYRAAMIFFKDIDMLIADLRDRVSMAKLDAHEENLMVEVE